MEAIWLWLRARWDQLTQVLRSQSAKLRDGLTARQDAQKQEQGDEAATPRQPSWLKRALKWLGIAALVLVSLIVLITLLVLLFGGEEEPARQSTNHWGMPTSGMEGMVGNPMRGLTIMSLIAGFALGGVAFSSSLSGDGSWRNMAGRSCSAFVFCSC